MWCGPVSNRRHKDFQSFALPTELPHLSRFFCFLSEVAKERFPFRECKYKGGALNSEIIHKIIPFPILNRAFMPFPTCRGPLKFTILRRSCKSNHVTDIGHTSYKLHHPLKTKPKASMRHCTKTAGI